MTKLRNAREQFNENYNLFGADPKSQTEKFNLYNGLANLTAGLEEMDQKLDLILQTLSQK